MKVCEVSVIEQPRPKTPHNKCYLQFIVWLAKLGNTVWWPPSYVYIMGTKMAVERSWFKVMVEMESSVHYL
jgi:hypothetical protein